MYATIEKFHRMHCVTITDERGSFVDCATMFSLDSARSFAISRGVSEDHIELLSMESA